jgi:prepilin peptidase CpaA
LEQLQLWRYPEIIVPDVICVVTCLMATIFDLRSRRIPNWLTFPAIGLGLLLNTVMMWITHGVQMGFKLGLVSSLAGSAFLLLVFGFLGALRFVGMGDVKLMGAVGALLRWPVAVWVLIYVALAGGGVALFYVLVYGKLKPVFKNLFKIGRRVFSSKDAKEKVELHRIPYALAIFIGSSWAILQNYFPRIGFF